MTKPTTPGIAELLDALQDAYNHLDDMRFVNEKINIGDYVADLEAQRDQARQTAEYWKAEHVAGNAEIDRLKAQRDEADRRAGAAERKNAELEDSQYRRNCWLDNAKLEWGVHRNVSFDDVWREALALKKAAIAQHGGKS